MTPLRETFRVAAAVLSATALPAPAVALAADTTPPLVDSVTCACVAPYQYSTVTFTAAAHDDESGIASVTWSFSDGDTGSGATVSHYLAQPGTLTATVAVTDGAGNTATSSTQVAVQANPFPPEPAYSEPDLSRLRLRPSTISAGGVTDGVARRTRLTFRVLDDFGTDKVVVVLRGLRGAPTARRVIRSVDDGDNALRLGTRVGGVRLRPGRYRVVVRAVNAYGSDTAAARLRIVR